MIDAPIIVTRLLLFSATLALFGAAAFFLYGLESEHAQWQRRTLIVSAAIALAASLAWFMAETASMTASPADAFHASALLSVLSETRLGKIGALRSALLFIDLLAALVLPAGRRLWIVATIVGALAVSSFAWSGHGVMNDGGPGLLHLTSDVLHLLAAGVWIGALVPLTMLLAGPSPSVPAARTIATALQRFSGLGPFAVALLILTGLANSAFLIDFGHWRASLASAYGLTLLAKLVLFGGMLALAVVNRLRLAPAVTAALNLPAPVTEPLRRLRNSVLTETLLALLVVVAVAVLGTLEPPLVIP